MMDWINHVPDRIAEAEYGEEGGIYTRFSLHYTEAFLFARGGWCYSTDSVYLWW